MKRILLIIAGSVSVALGVLGIFLPILPTTPFLLLAAACYAKSSDKLYNKLLNNKYLGKYIRNYRERRGIPKKTKIITISFLWLSILFSAFTATTLLWLRILLFVIAIAVTAHILKLKTLERDD